jgi:hypothetical protein
MSPIRGMVDPRQMPSWSTMITVRREAAARIDLRVENRTPPGVHREGDDRRTMRR